MIPKLFGSGKCQRGDGVLVISRKAGRPKLRRLDRILLAAFSRLLSRERWGFSVTPQTPLRWHRDLVRRKWTYDKSGGGRPRIDQKIQDLILTMAEENPRWGYMRIKGECQKLGIRVSRSPSPRVTDGLVPPERGLSPAVGGTPLNLVGALQIQPRTPWSASSENTPRTHARTQGCSRSARASSPSPVRRPWPAPTLP